MTYLKNIITGLAAFSMATLLRSTALAANLSIPTTRVSNIVLVHGAFADATSWAKVIPILEGHGYHVVAVQNPLTSLKDDVAAIQRAIALQDGPVLLVAHSWGGVPATQAGADPKVVGLVYISAYAPEVGQSANDASAPYGWTAGQKQIHLDGTQFASMSFEGVSKDIAPCLSDAAQRLFFAAQGQSFGPMFDEKISVAAWNSKPSWVLISSDDRMLPPAMEKAESTRPGAVASLTLSTCHMSIIARADKVAAFIETASKSVPRNRRAD
jgi:pimeloyl-ACP methyl ester carboxylesterase